MGILERKECVMLAAGLSRRMGKWKLMMPWGAGTILDSAINNALVFCDRVVLVTGHRGDELAAYYQGHARIDIVHNPDYQAGMFSSVQCGAAAITSPYFFLALGDMPEVKPEIYDILWRERTPTSCLIPGYDRGKGHPILLPRLVAGLIAQASQGTTLKDVIRQMETHIIPVTEQGIHWDIDTPGQYQQIAHLRNTAKAASH